MMPPLPDEDTNFLLSLPRFAAEAGAQANTFDVNVAEYYRDKACSYTRIIHVFADRAKEFVSEIQGNDNDQVQATELAELFDILLVHFLAIRGLFQTRMESLAGPVPIQLNTADTSVGVIRTGNVGRPSKHIQPHHVEPLRELGFKWCSIAKILCVSERTLRNRRHHNDAFRELELDFARITDDELDQTLREVMSITSRSGETYMIGALRSRGLRIQRWRLRESLGRVDSVGRALRRRRVIQRRRYSVPSPNYIWHIDGNHKLIDPWGFVIHGAIDGYSRLCVYLHCTTSNKASIVLDLFKEAVESYGCPKHIRTDYGTENVAVARFMLQQRGLDQGSVITGLSTHNQRIERLWRDVKECITSIFSDIFFYMETEGIADRYNNTHVAAMRYVFCPRLNRALQEFKSQWNNHPLRTVNNRSPNMLWVEGMVGTDAHTDFHLQNLDDQDPVPDIQTNNNVQVPDVTLDVSEADMFTLQSQIDPLIDDGNQGIQLFKDTVQYLLQHQE